MFFINVDVTSGDEYTWTRKMMVINPFTSEHIPVGGVTHQQLVRQGALFNVEPNMDMFRIIPHLTPGEVVDLEAVDETAALPALPNDVIYDMILVPNGIAVDKASLVCRQKLIDSKVEKMAHALLEMRKHLSYVELFYVCQNRRCPSQEIMFVMYVGQEDVMLERVIKTVQGDPPHTQAHRSHMRFRQDFNGHEGLVHMLKGFLRNLESINDLCYSLLQPPPSVTESDDGSDTESDEINDSFEVPFRHVEEVDYPDSDFSQDFPDNDINLFQDEDIMTIDDLHGEVDLELLEEAKWFLHRPFQTRCAHYSCENVLPCKSSLWVQPQST